MVKGESARELKSVNELVENQFLVISKEYVSWVNTEEEKSVLQAAALQSGLHGLTEAFLESRRQERTKTLEIHSLKQLRKRERKIQSSKRNQQHLKPWVCRLEGQLRSMQASMSWKLAKMLSCINARVPSLLRRGSS